MHHLVEEQEKQKRAIYESLSPRRKKFIDRIGYEKWDPFQEPKDPRKVKTDATNRTTKQLVRDFLSEFHPEDYSNAYGQGVRRGCSLPVRFPIAVHLNKGPICSNLFGQVAALQAVFFPLTLFSSCPRAESRL
jgi:hypothetical protein